MVQLSLELFKLYNFRMLHCLNTVQRRQLVLGLSGELGLNILHKGVQFLHSVLLRLLHFLDRALHLTNIVLQIPEPSAQATGLPSDQIYMLLVDLLQLLKRVLLVLIAEQATVRADRYLARLAIVAQGRVMLLTELFSALLVLILLLLHHLHDICEEATGDELICAQAGTAVRALGPRLLNPLFQACATGQFGAMWAHDRVLDSAKAYETTEELIKLDLAVGAPATPIGPNPRIDRLDTRSAISRPSRS